MKPRPGAQLWLLPLLLTLVTAGVVYWPFLGYSSLSHSEGHRAVTGWQMLDSGHYLLPRLFEHLYLRKPPGMPWAVAFMSALLGQTEFAARSVSALASTLAACISCLAACRWFGRTPGLVAGVAFPLTPLFLYPGRSAEIEALNNFFCLASMIASIWMVSALRTRQALIAATLAGISTGCMLLTKGPAGIPCTLVACIAAAWAFRSLRAALLSPALWISLLIPSLLFGAYLLAAKIEFARLAEPAITEPPSHFLWNPARLAAIFALPLAAVASAFPQGLALFLVIRRAPRAVYGTPFATSIVLACVGALLVYMIAGVANPRYAMPALTLLPLCCGIASWHLQITPSASSRIRSTFARAAVVAAVASGLVVTGQAAWLEYRREFRTGGRSQGFALAAHLPDGALVDAFEMIDQRPELLYYTQLAAAQAGKSIRIRWRPYPAVFGHSGSPLLPPPGAFVLLRTDSMPRDQYPPELTEFTRFDLLPRLGPELYSGKVHNFAFSLRPVLETPQIDNRR